MTTAARQTRHLHSTPGEGRGQEAENGLLDEKWLQGGNAPKIDRIYSNDSNIETAEESALDSNDPLLLSDCSPHQMNNFFKLVSPCQNETSPASLQFQKYQSDLARSQLDIVGEGTEGAGKEDSVILEQREQRESNRSASFEAAGLSLQISSVLKPAKPRQLHSFLLDSHSVISPGQGRNRTMNEENKREGQMSESRARKNACLKKKATLTAKDGSEASFQEEENWAAKSSRKVNFKGEGEAAHSPERSKKPSLPTHTPKKTNRRGESITSIICLSGKNSEEVVEPTLKSSRTLHDLGNNHLIYRLRGSQGTVRACQAVEVASSEEGRREAEVFALVRSHPHPNVLRLHTITIEPKGDRTVLLQTVDFYPRNLYQYLTDLAENNVPVEQRARERKLILFQVLNGLNFLHRQQITHRNLTPAGVLLSDSLHTVLAGFSSLDSPRLALRTGLKCEWLIRPPEIVMQPHFPYGSAGDVWEFGCLVVFMLRGRMPFQEYSDSGLVVEMSKCIGRPSREDRNAIGLVEPHKFIFPHFRRESIGKSFQCQEQDLVDLLRKVFVFNPLKRATAAELIRSPYFDDLRDSSRFSLSGLLEEEETSVVCQRETRS